MASSRSRAGSTEYAVHNEYGNGWTPLDPSYFPKVLKHRGSYTNLLNNNERRNSKESRILVLFTGGTIGMIRGANGAYEPISNMLEDKLRTTPYLHDHEYAKAHFSKENPCPLVLPYAPDYRRVVYTVFEYNPILDSSNMTMDDWIRIALDIKRYYDQFDGFVILHGTDTLSYTASALSFMMEHLGKPIIITGSQIPIFEARSDGQDNFLGALIIAGNYHIPEVAVYFNNQLFRGNRTTKVSTNELKAFASPNMPPLVQLGIDIVASEKFAVHTNLNRHVGLLRLFPSISTEMIQAYFRPPMQGVVLQTFGSGNIPSLRDDLLEEFRKASQRGVIIVNTTQCLYGSISSDYAPGQTLLELGVVPGADMTPEAALAKLSYILGKDEWSIETKRKMMMSNLRGEMTLEKRMKLKDLNLMTGLAKAMQLSHSQDKDSIRNILFPSIICAAVAENDLQKLALLQQYGDLNCCDLDGRTPLHIAAAEGRLEIAKYLLQNGANIIATDNQHRTPLDCAISGKHLKLVKLLHNLGAVCNKPSESLGEMLCSAAMSGDLKTLQAYQTAGVNLTSKDSCGRTALHQAVLSKHNFCIEFLLSAGLSPLVQDAFGITPLDFALKLGLSEIVERLRKWTDSSFSETHTDD